MDILIYVATAVLLIILTIYFSWLFNKNKSYKQRLSEQDQEIESLKNQLSKELNVNKETTHALNSSNAQNAGLIAHVQGLTKTVEEQKTLLEKEKEALEFVREANKQSLTAKTKAETSLENADSKIVDLERDNEKLDQENRILNSELSEIKETNSTLKAQHEETIIRLQEQQQFVNNANERLKDAFNSLSAEALKNNNESFITLAKSTLETQVTEAKGDLEKKQEAIESIVKPLTDSLGKFDGKMQELEKVRMEQHGQINQYILGIQQSTEKLQKETHNLVTALKSSHTRGKYGEIALRRVVEFAGMTEHCDFQEQVSVVDENGILRPDMTIRLPERRTIVVDSKTPLDSYMKAFETEDEEERKNWIRAHAIAVRDHLKKLSAKAYWSQMNDSPDYVVLYMQIESSFGAAIQSDPSLIEDGIRNKIIFATPTTLITLLKTVGFVWQQVRITDNIEEIRNSGIELYNRTTVLLKHFASIGGSLKGAVTHYNSAVASLESRFVPHAKRLYDLGSAYTRSILPEVNQVDQNVRDLIAAVQDTNEIIDGDSINNEAVKN